MANVRYYNQTGPFWDFIADLERQGFNNPARDRTTGAEDDETHGPAHDHPNNPWAQGWGQNFANFPWGPMPHRGRHGGPPPPPPPPAQQEENNNTTASENEKAAQAGPSDPADPSSPEDDTRPHRRGHHGHGAGGFRRGGHCGGGRGGMRGPWFGRGGRGPHFHPYAFGGPWGGLAEMFGQQLFGGGRETDAERTPGHKGPATEDFRPEADVFDTPEAFVVLVSLPGAKKEDVGVNWDAEKSELSVAGVIHRPGDEEFLKTLALDERRVGAFERKVRLGSRANPAQVDVEAIAARMEDGVLTVEVPKIIESGFVDVKKVEIE